MRRKSTTICASLCPPQAAVATLSKGPVCPSDAIGHVDTALILRSATADGTLLQPDTPASLLDRCFLGLAALGHSAPVGTTTGSAGVKRSRDGRTLDRPPRGDIWYAATEVSGRRFAVVLAARVRGHPALYPSDLGYTAVAEAAAAETADGGATGTLAQNLTRGAAAAARDGIYASSLVAVSPLVAVESPLPSSAVPEATTHCSTHAFAQEAPLWLRACGKSDFQIWHVAPREANGWALLGEVSGAHGILADS